MKMLGVNMTFERMASIGGFSEEDRKAGGTVELHGDWRNTDVVRVKIGDRSVTVDAANLLAAVLTVSKPALIHKSIWQLTRKVFR